MLLEKRRVALYQGAPGGPSCGEGSPSPETVGWEVGAEWAMLSATSQWGKAVSKERWRSCKAWRAWRELPGEAWLEDTGWWHRGSQKEEFAVNLLASCEGGPPGNQGTLWQMYSYFDKNKSQPPPPHDIGQDSDSVSLHRRTSQSKTISLAQ